jgi:hypothetical protein
MTDQRPRPEPEVPESFYAHHFALFDRFVGFSSEIVRLSLAGMAAIGFLVATLVGRDSDALAAPLRSPLFQVTMGLSLLMFALAAGLALAHRYRATDGMYYLLEKLRKEAQLGTGVPAAKAITAELKSSEKNLQRSAVMLFLGTVALGFGFLVMMRTVA